MALVLSIVIVAPVRAAGSLYISPSDTPSQTSGSSLDFQILVADIDPFNGWDISVRVDSAALTPVSISLEGNLLVTNYGAQVTELANCVNGLGQGCRASDGPGVVRSAAVATGSSFTSGTASGILFTITYEATGGPYSTVQIFDDVIANGGTQATHTTTGATYGQSQGPLVGGISGPSNTPDSWLLYAVLVSSVAAVIAIAAYARRKREA